MYRWILLPGFISVIFNKRYVDDIKETSVLDFSRTSLIGIEAQETLINNLIQYYGLIISEGKDNYENINSFYDLIKLFNRW